MKITKKVKFHPMDIACLVPCIAVLYNVHLKNFLRYVCIFAGIPDISIYLNAGLILVLCIMSLYIIKKLSLQVLRAVLCLICILAAAWGYSFFVNRRALVENMDVFLYIEYIPACIITACLQDYRCLLKNFTFHGRILMAYMILELYKYLTDPLAFSYNMTYGYTCVFLFLIFFCAVKKGFAYKKINILCAVFCGVTSVAYGSRAVVAILFIYVVYLMIRNRKIKGWVKFAVILAGAALLLLRKPLANILYNMVLDLTGYDMIPLKRLGFSLGERSDLWDFAVSYILGEMPVLGGGLYADRMALAETGVYGYVHNVFLEVIMDFGIFGFLMAFILAGAILYAIFLNKNEPYFVGAVTVYTTVYLFFSSSYLTNQYFWFMTGMLIGIIGRNGKIKNKNGNIFVMKEAVKFV